MSTFSIVWGRKPVRHRDKESKYRSYELVGYTNNSYVGDINDQKSIIGYCFFFGGAIIIWCSKRQQTFFISKLEVEYVAMS